MKDAGPLGELVTLVVAFCCAVAILCAGGLLWMLAEQLIRFLSVVPWWAWILSSAAVGASSCWWYIWNWIEWYDHDGYHACWRWELPAEPYAAPTQTGGLVVPTNVTLRYCDQCGSRLRARTCPMCGHQA